MTLPLADEEFNSIVSLHTIEHIKDDHAFLKTLRRLLKTNGTAVLEAPIFTKSVYKDVTIPLNPYHLREYYKDELIKICSRFFEIERIFGVNRGCYTSEELTRNAMMLVLKKGTKDAINCNDRRRYSTSSCC